MDKIILVTFLHCRIHERETDSQGRKNIALHFCIYGFSEEYFGVLREILIFCVAKSEIRVNRMLHVPKKTTATLIASVIGG